MSVLHFTKSYLIQNTNQSWRNSEMNSREKIRKIFDLKSDGAFGFWTGNPHIETEKMYLKQLGFHEREELFRYLKDDCRWVIADEAYQHHEGRPMFDMYLGEAKHFNGQEGCFRDCESLKEIEEFPWPEPKYLDFSEIKESIGLHQDKAVFSGMWSCFFHVVADFFGMENYFVKMHTDPEIVEAVTEHVVNFYCEATDLFFKAIGDQVDTFFFGNDFGTQLDLLISPDSFRKFVLPGFKRLIQVAKKYNKKVLLHSCGSIYKVIPLLIDAGIDALHPLQAKARDMDAVTLAREFKNHIAFVGGVDTQELLINAKPQEIKNEVYRLKELLGPNYIISPSHECILPNVPLENIIAMAEAARE